MVELGKVTAKGRAVFRIRGSEDSDGEVVLKGLGPALGRLTEAVEHALAVEVAALNESEANGADDE